MKKAALFDKTIWYDKLLVKQKTLKSYLKIEFYEKDICYDMYHLKIAFIINTTLN